MHLYVPVYCTIHTAHTRNKLQDMTFS